MRPVCAGVGVQAAGGGGGGGGGSSTSGSGRAGTRKRGGGRQTVSASLCDERSISLLEAAMVEGGDERWELSPILVVACGSWCKRGSVLHMAMLPDLSWRWGA